MIIQEKKEIEKKKFFQDGGIMDVILIPHKNIVTKF